MVNRNYYEDILERENSFREPPGILIYRELMISLLLMTPERCGVVLQNVFQNVLHGSSPIDMSLSECETDLIIRALEKHADDTVSYQEKVRKSKIASQKAAARRARRLERLTAEKAGGDGESE